MRREFIRYSIALSGIVIGVHQSLDRGWLMFGVMGIVLPFILMIVDFAHVYIEKRLDELSAELERTNANRNVERQVQNAHVIQQPQQQLQNIQQQQVHQQQQQLPPQPPQQQIQHNINVNRNVPNMNVLNRFQKIKPPEKLTRSSNLKSWWRNLCHM